MLLHVCFVLLLASVCICEDEIHGNFTPGIVASSSYLTSPPVGGLFGMAPAVQFLPKETLSSRYSAASVVLQRLPVNVGKHTNLRRSTTSTNNNNSSADNSSRTTQYGIYNNNDDIGNTSNNSSATQPSGDDTDTANVLILHPIYAGSHEVVLRVLGVELVKRGHEVTQLRWKCDNHAIDITQNEHPAGSAGADVYDYAADDRFLDVITVSADNSDMRYPYMSSDGSLQLPSKLLWDTERSIYNVPIDVFGLVDAQCSTLLGDAALIAALRHSNFTVALVDVIANECSLALARILGLPVLAYWGFPLQGGEPRRMGVYHLPSTVPAMMSELGSSMTYWQRVANTVLALLDELLVTYHTTVTDYWIQLLHPQLPSSTVLLQEVDALLVSVSWHIDYPKLLPPHVHYIGCLLCRPGAPLHPRLQNWVSSAGSAGIVVFSFGLTGFDPRVVPKKFREGVLKALSRLDQKVVLQFDPTKLENIPDNVLAMESIPQQDLLAHSQTQLFVSHCGMNSVNEAAYHGKPLICVPNFADQGDISHRVMDRGLGLVLAKQTLTRDTLFDAIQEILNNKTYKRNVNRISRMWKEEPSGLETAIRWVEKVHRYGPLEHTRPPGRELSFLQYYCIDVLLLLAALATLIIACIVITTKITCTFIVRHLIYRKNKLKVQ
uniref:UDP-glucuronosyltransferase 2B33-like n=2 Tax=Hirondellea gigas TaxID=1518452 RepID=A0A6A7G7R0_9CRUS